MPSPNSQTFPELELEPEQIGAEDGIVEDLRSYGMHIPSDAEYFEAVGTSDRLGDYEGEDDASYTQG